MNSKEWFGFTEDKVFGWVMEDGDFCKYILQLILPDIEIEYIEKLELQKEINDVGKENKDVRLDVLVMDKKHRVYNVECQTTNQYNLGKRMRYYQSKIDQYNTLKKGSTYTKLKDYYIIFLCTFDPFNEGRIKYSFHSYEDSNRLKRLDDGANKIIINANGSTEDVNEEMKALIDLMNGRQVSLNKYFQYAQRKIMEINEDQEKREQIMEYETRMMEKEELGEKRGKLEAVHALIDYHLKDGKDLEDIFQYLNDLHLIPEKELKKLINTYR